MSHFSITGEAITGIARDIWASQDYGKAISLLLAAIPKLEVGQVVDICCGKKKLIGPQNSINLEDDTFYDNAEDKPLLLVEVLNKYKKEVSELKDELRDWEALDAHNTKIVGSPTGARLIPSRRKHWSEAKVWRDIDYVSPRIPAINAQDTPDKPIEVYKIPEPFNKITSHSGLISPEGKFYPCEFHEHRMLADALANITQLEDSPIGQGQTILAKAGWISLYEAGEIRDKGIAEGEIPATEAQQKMVLDYCIENSLQLPCWMVEEEEKI